MNGIMNEAKIYKAFLSNYGASSCSVVFPSGKSITIDPAHPYYTADPEELRELSMMRHVSITNPNAGEVLRYVFNPENLPHLARNIMPGDSVIETWKWTPTDEKVIANVLKARGYKVEFIKDQTQDEFYEAKDTDKLIAILDARGYNVVPKQSEVSYEDMTKSELLTECGNLGVKASKTMSNTKLIELIKGALDA